MAAQRLAGALRLGLALWATPVFPLRKWRQGISSEVQPELQEILAQNKLKNKNHKLSPELSRHGKVPRLSPQRLIN